jgi:hypothetical protein
MIYFKMCYKYHLFYFLDLEEKLYKIKQNNIDITKEAI